MLALVTTLQQLLVAAAILASVRSSVVRFVMFSMQHSGTHYVRNVFLQQPNVYLWDEVCILKTFDNVFNETKCLDRIRFTLALPNLASTKSLTNKQVLDFINHRMHNNTYGRSAKPLCRSSGGGEEYSAQDCYKHSMQQAHAVGCIVQMQQGWGSLSWTMDFLQLVRDNRQQGVDIRVLVLHRLNSIAHSISATNTKEFLPNQSYPLKPVNVRTLHVKYADFRNKFSNTVRSLMLNDVNVVYVSYERLLILGNHSVERQREVAGSFEGILAALGLPVTYDRNTIHISAGTKHHTNGTYSYIQNLDEVQEELRNAKYESVGAVRDCMLFDRCAYPEPAFCQQIPCFV